MKIKDEVFLLIMVALLALYCYEMGFKYGRSDTLKSISYISTDGNWGLIRLSNHASLINGTHINKWSVTVSNK